MTLFGKHKHQSVNELFLVLDDCVCVHAVCSIAVRAHPEVFLSSSRPLPLRARRRAVLISCRNRPLSRATHVWCICASAAACFSQWATALYHGTIAACRPTTSHETQTVTGEIVRRIATERVTERDGVPSSVLDAAWASFVRNRRGEACLAGSGCLLLVLAWPESFNALLAQATQPGTGPAGQWRAQTSSLGSLRSPLPLCGPRTPLEIASAVRATPRHGRASTRRMPASAAEPRARATTSLVTARGLVCLCVAPSAVGVAVRYGWRFRAAGRTPDIVVAAHSSHPLVRR